MIKTQLLLIFTLPILVFGQHSYFQHIGISDGLESDNVYSCLQDADGYMWFGTDMGVSRFNGYGFENFDFEDGLTGNEIFSIYEDSESRIWFLSFNGEISYFRNEKFYNVTNDPWLAGFECNSYLTAFHEADDGTIYISSFSDGVFILAPNETIKNIPSLRSIYKIWSTENNEVRYLTPGGVFKLEGDEFTPVNEFKLMGSYSRATIVGSELYFGYRNGFYYLNETPEKIIEIPGNPEITWVAPAGDSLFYLGTRSGLYTYSMTRDSLWAKNYFEQFIVTHTLVDREGNLWVTTLGEGIFLSPSTSVKIYNSEGALPVDQITCLERGFDGDLWIGMRGGHYANLKKGHLETYRLAGHNNQRVTRIKTFDEDGVAIATKSNIGIRKGEKIGYFNFLANDILISETEVYLASKQVHIVDRDFFFDRVTLQPQPSDAFQFELEAFLGLSINASVVCEGPNEKIYVGTQKGLYKWEYGEMVELAVKLDDSRLTSSINDLHFDMERGVLYVATNSEGLVLLKDDEILYNLTSDHGLSSNNCQSIFGGEPNALWIGTSKNLDLITIDTGKIELINYGGLLNFKTTKISDIEKIDEMLYLATDLGLIVLNTKDYSENLLPPKMSLRSFRVNSIRQDTTRQSVALKHYQNSVAFEFIGISYKNIGNLNYIYKLDGYQEDWHSTKSTRVIFEALSPGEYTFIAKAISPNNLESNPISVSFVINRPFWRATWFAILVGLFVLLCIAGIWFLRIKRIRKRFEFEKRLVAGELEKLEMEKAYLLAELKAGVLQMNPHFLFNSLNAIKGYYAQNRFQEANRFISRFSKLLRLILECNTQLIPLHKEIEILSLYLELMQKRYDDVFEFKIDCLIPEIEKIKLPPMMLQPIVENAVIHGLAPQSNGKVEITFTQKGGCLICTVADNGVGFYKSNKQLHQSVGIKNIRDRMDLLSEQFKAECTIHIESPIPNTEKGTVVRLQFPIKFADYLIK